MYLLLLLDKCLKSSGSVIELNILIYSDLLTLFKEVHYSAKIVRIDPKNKKKLYLYSPNM